MITSTWIPLLTVGAMIIGGVFAALRFNRQDAQAVVQTQSTVLQDMKALNTELGHATDRIRTERDELLTNISACATEIAQLRDQIHGLQAQVKELRKDLKDRQL